MSEPGGGKEKDCKTWETRWGSVAAPVSHSVAFPQGRSGQR